MSKNKVLFILKRRHDYNAVLHSEFGMSTGLFNSAYYMYDMLKENGVPSKLVVVKDNNDIDREVHNYKPTHVIIEALWVVPSKFTVLCKLHPKVKWIIRLHSDLPFIANEGMAMDWIGDYFNYKNVAVAANSPRMLNELKEYYLNKFPGSKHDYRDQVIYLPNYYPQNYKKKHSHSRRKHINIGCFGAVRPMKNHLLQAIAAIKFADLLGKKLKFHINAGRVEQRGDTVLNNLKSLFAQIHKSGHRLILHDWMSRDEFLKVCEKMDISMQVSFSETFNIVLADCASKGVPVIGSKEIPWISSLYKCDSTSSDDVRNKLVYTYMSPSLNVFLNQRGLKKYTDRTKKIWLKYFKK